MERQCCGAEDAPNMVFVAIMAQLVAQHMAQGSFIRCHGGRHIDSGGEEPVETGGLHRFRDIHGAGTIHFQSLPRAAQAAGKDGVDHGEPHRHKTDTHQPYGQEDVFGEVLHITGTLPTGELLCIGIFGDLGIDIGGGCAVKIEKALHITDDFPVGALLHAGDLLQPLQILGKLRTLHQ